MRRYRKSALGLVLGAAVVGVGLAGIATMTSAQTAQGCTNASLSGEYAFKETGMILSSDGSTIDFAAVGKATYDGEGGFTATDTTSMSGKITPDATVSGTYVVQPDCTGSATATAGGTTIQSNFVLFDRGRQSYSIWNTPGTAVTAEGVKLDGQPTF
jgi:hypothetical protein